jgi:ABC-2 type transport system permease protein
VSSRRQALRWKEFLLLRRDPWLVSQTLMQLLYLVPPAARVIRAKIEVVLIAIGVIFAPLVMALLFASPLQAAVTACGVIIAASSATAIQLWFRVQAKRSQFRRRQTSSRLATFSEAFSSIGWAATAALALAVPVAAVISGLMTAAILAATWKISPRRE